ncbi:MAG TPA: T9SS type A sorting domain-containing protein [Candidatus Krumholzibacteria bacterium]|nr:T9SS type A sorting domain-containing protein [Candidatus Krumholzibacteria bacterium]
MLGRPRRNTFGPGKDALPQSAGNEPTQHGRRGHQGEPSSYSDQFKAVYGTHIFDNTQAAYAKIADALAAYLSSPELNPFTSKYDAHLAGQAHLNRQEALGLAVFEGKGGCSGCHPSARGAGGASPLFTDYSFHNVGVPRNPNNPFFGLASFFNPDGDAWVDFGSGAVLSATEEMGKMKVPTLRNIARTAPYGHNGIFLSLRGVVEFCANRNVSYHLEPEVPMNVNTADFGNAGLRAGEIDALVAFLNTLTDGYTQDPRKDPNIRPYDPPVGTDTPAIGRTVAISISPNPFNPVTRIDYSVDGSTTVQLGVYDVSGRLVVRLVNENVTAGSYVATWDGRDARGASVASGIYFVRLDAGRQTLVRKAVLTR